jgi:CO/xanthine dehydrogenase FAD-binding subunit
MKAVDFDYQRPGSLGEACRLLAGAGEDGKIIAGGQTLVPLLAMRLARPALLIDINGIAELQGIDAGDEHVDVRAGTRQAGALADETIRRRVPLLAKALGFVGHIQTRNRGTVGGSLANADPAAEIGLAALTLDAQLFARSTTGKRTIPIVEFLVAPMVTALAAEECLTTIRFPLWREAGRLGTGFQEISARRSDFALAAAAVQLLLDASGMCRRIAVSVSVGGAGTHPIRVAAAAERLTGTSLAERDLADAAELVMDAVEPGSDLPAAVYRRRLAGALAERAVAEAKADAMAVRG